MFGRSSDKSETLNNRLEIRLDILSDYLEARGVLPRLGGRSSWRDWKRSSTQQQQQKTENSDNGWSTQVKEIGQLIDDALSNAANPSSAAASSSPPDEDNLSEKALGIIQETLHARFQSPAIVSQIIPTTNNDEQQDTSSSPPPPSNLDDGLLSTLNFFDIQSIHTSLLSHDNMGKSLLTRSYKSPLLSTWNDILTKYTTSQTHLFQSIHILKTAVRFQIPHLQNSLSETKQKLKKLGKVRDDVTMKHDEACEVFNKRCIELGIEGADAEGEIDALAAVYMRQGGVFEDMEKTMRMAEGLGEAIAYYRDFVSFLRQRDGAGEDILPALRRLLDGDVLSSEEMTELTTPAAAAEVSESSSSDDPAAGDEWDIVSSHPEEDQWDISVEESGISSSPPSSSPPPPPRTTSLLSSPTIRTTILCDLIELSFFLHQRHAEITHLSTQTATAEIHLSRAPDNITMPDPSTTTIQKHYQTVDALIKRLRTGSFASMVAIAENDRYRRGLVRDLDVKFRKVMKWQEAMSDVERRRVEMRRMVGDVEGAWELGRRRGRMLKEELEREVERCLRDGRVVKIIGEEFDCLI